MAIGERDGRLTAIKAGIEGEALSEIDAGGVRLFRG